jgi:hypothetical protein
MNRHVKSLVAVTLLNISMNILSTAAAAQKVKWPAKRTVPMPLMGKLPLMRRLPIPGMGKIPMSLLGNNPMGLMGKNPMGLMANNPIAWMTHLNNVGNQNVANIYKACISHPGACNGLASQQSLNNAIQGVQNESLINSQHQMVNQNIQTQSVKQTNCAVTGGTVYWNRNTQQNECSH